VYASPFMKKHQEYTREKFTNREKMFVSLKTRLLNQSKTIKRCEMLMMMTF